MRIGFTTGQGVFGGQSSRKASIIFCILSISSEWRPAPNSAMKPPFP